MSPFRSGYVALVGRPNVGKSTLMNRVLDEKVSIVTYKPQTTRNRILGILSTDGYQVLFLDTPGLHDRPERGIDGFMVAEARSALADADVVAFLTEANVPHKADGRVLSLVKEARAPAVAIINKIDKLADKRRLLPRMERLAKEGFEEVIPISALKNDGVDLVVNALVDRMPEGPAYFPGDQLSDQNLRFVAAEIVREKVFLTTHAEIPYSTAVLIEEYSERGDGSAFIRATVLVERDSQKGIVIGKNGENLKRIGRDARAEIEPLQGGKVFLELFVRVSKDWTRNPRVLKELGYER